VHVVRTTHALGAKPNESLTLDVVRIDIDVNTILPFLRLREALQEDEQPDLAVVSHQDDKRLTLPSGMPATQRGGRDSASRWGSRQSTTTLKGVLTG
jgi:hypothetical protein